MAENRSKSDGFMLRFPDGMRDQLKAAAERAGRSMNAEIIFRIEESFLDPISIRPRLRRRIERDAEAKGLSWKEQAVAALETVYPGGMALGEFLENHVLPAARESSSEIRKHLIGIANFDHEGLMAGLFVEEQCDETGLVTLTVYQSDDDSTSARSEVARIVVTAADKTAS